MADLDDVEASQLATESTQVLDVILASSQPDEWPSTPVDLVDKIANNRELLLPDASAAEYDKAWEGYRLWCYSRQIKRVDACSPETIGNWAHSMLQVWVYNTVKSRLAMIKKQILIHFPDCASVDTTRAEAILKKKEFKFETNKAATFTKSQLEDFWANGPEDMLDVKVASILSVFGALRKCELYNLLYNNIVQEPDGYLVTVTGVKRHRDRSFWIEMADAGPLTQYVPQSLLHFCCFVIKF